MTLITNIKQILIYKVAEVLKLALFNQLINWYLILCVIISSSDAILFFK